ncbi:MAG: MBL fold metallo-hydrolase [Coriobacteriales bacterium]|jgi:phosphoribosyl 1,2-cyclic phosphodiesterase
MKLEVLGSGSKGNCAILETESTAIMIDAGLSRKAMRDRAAELGVDESKICSLLITHEHNDHVKGLGVCLRGLRLEGKLPIYCTSGTRSSNSYLSNYENFVNVCAGDGFDIGDIHVDVFNTSHDAAEPIGFRFTQVSETDGVRTIGYMTDSGYCTPMAMEMLPGCQVLAIETNHDMNMLKTGPYPSYLKKRIASDSGHLSNDQAASALEQLASDELECVIGMHISQENNYVDIPTQLLEHRLSQIGIDANVLIAGQNIPKGVGRLSSTL